MKPGWRDRLCRRLPPRLAYLLDPKLRRLVKGLRRVEAAHEAHQRHLALRISMPGGGALLLILALFALAVPLLADDNDQGGIAGISPRAFGDKCWRKNGQPLLLTGNTVWDAAIGTDGRLYYWGPDLAWHPLVTDETFTASAPLAYSAGNLTLGSLTFAQLLGVCTGSPHVLEWAADGTVACVAPQAGPQGIQGIQGVPGTAGTTGPKGDKGDAGDAGAPGAPGANGVDGTPGAPGANGTNGTNGAPGADGIPRTIQDEGADLTQRLKINFTGPGVTAADDSANSRTNVTISTPAHASTHQPGGSDPLVVDAVAGTGSLRTLGTGASQAAAGNDGRFADPRTPTAHASTHKNGGGDEVATATAAANAIPKAGSGGNLDIGWLPLVTPAKGGFGADNSAASGIPVFAAGTATVTATTGTGAPVRATSATLTTPSFSGGIAGDLQFGGTTSSFPMFSRTGNEMKLRNADDSGYTNLRLDRVYTFNGNTIKVQLSGDANSVGLASNSFIFWISSADVGGAGSGDTGLARGTAGVVTVDTATAGNAAGTLKATKIQYVPTGGVTCNSAAKGLTYVASGDGTFCACNGTVWSPLPSTGTCN